MKNWRPGLLLALAACQARSPPVEQAIDGSWKSALLTFEDLVNEVPEEINDRRVTLDLFRPENTRLRSLVVLVHGGSLVGGDKSGF